MLVYHEAHEGNLPRSPGRRTPLRVGWLLVGGAFNAVAVSPLGG